MLTRFCRDCFVRCRKLVKYWLTFDEEDSTIRHPFTTAGIIPGRVPEEKLLETCYQGLHHQLVASALVTRDCREIIPGSQVGCMLTKLTTYARTCAPRAMEPAHTAVGEVEGHVVVRDSVYAAGSQSVGHGPEAEQGEEVADGEAEDGRGGHGVADGGDLSGPQAAGEAVALEAGDHGSHGDDHREEPGVGHGNAELSVHGGPGGAQQGVGRARADKERQMMANSGCSMVMVPLIGWEYDITKSRGVVAENLLHDKRKPSGRWGPLREDVGFSTAERKLHPLHSLLLSPPSPLRWASAGPHISFSLRRENGPCTVHWASLSGSAA